MPAVQGVLVVSDRAGRRCSTCSSTSCSAGSRRPRDGGSDSWCANPRSCGPAGWPCVLLSIILFLAIFGPLLAPYDPLAGTDRPLAGPSWAHPLGTDYLGRDVLSRILAGSPVSVLGAVEVATIALLVGAMPGILSVYLGRIFEWLTLRFADTLIALPFLVFAVAMTALLGNGITQAMFAVGILVSPVFYRVSRAATLTVSQSQYVEAAILAGASTSAGSSAATCGRRCCRRSRSRWPTPWAPGWSSWPA